MGRKRVCRQCSPQESVVEVDTGRESNVRGRLPGPRGEAVASNYGNPINTRNRQSNNPAGQSRDAEVPHSPDMLVGDGPNSNGDTMKAATDTIVAAVSEMQGVVQALTNTMTQFLQPKPVMDIGSRRERQRRSHHDSARSSSTDSHSTSSRSRPRQESSSSSAEDSDQEQRARSTASAYSSSPTRRTRHRDRRHGNAKLPVFTGKEQWKVWYNRFNEVAERRGWSDEDKLDELLPLIQGAAGEFVYGQLSHHTRSTYKLLTAELSSRYMMRRNLVVDSSPFKNQSRNMLQI
jgi:hypothetical protein